MGRSAGSRASAAATFGADLFTLDEARAALGPLMGEGDRLLGVTLTSLPVGSGPRVVRQLRSPLRVGPDGRPPWRSTRSRYRSVECRIAARRAIRTRPDD